MKTQAVVISEQGDPGVMSVTDVDIGSPGPGEVLLEQSAIGLNYMDVYQRSGHYRLDLPSGLGLEAAGRVLEIGNGVTSVQVDDRVAYAGGLPGAYANHRIVSVDRLVPIPDGVSERTVARRRKQQPLAELGYGDLGIVRCFGNHDAALARRVKIERLKAGAPHRDDFDIGQLVYPGETTLLGMYPFWLLGLVALYPLCVRYDRWKRSRSADSLWRLF